MSQPLVFVTTHTINEGQTEAVEQLARRFAERAESSDASLISYHHYLDQDGSKVTNVQVHADSESMEAFLPDVGDLIPEALAIAPAHSIEVYGTPGPTLQMALDSNAEAGATVRVVDRHLSGFHRSAGARAA